MKTTDQNSVIDYNLVHHPAATDAAPQTAQWPGATIKSIETSGELSSVGLGDRNGVLLVEAPDVPPPRSPV